MTASSHLKLEVKLQPIWHTTLRPRKRCHDRPRAFLILRAMEVRASPGSSKTMRGGASALEFSVDKGVQQRHLVQQQIFGESSEEPHSLPSNAQDPSPASRTLGDGTLHPNSSPPTLQEAEFIDLTGLPQGLCYPVKSAEKLAYSELQKPRSTTSEPTLALKTLHPGLRAVFESSDFTSKSSHRVETLPKCDSPTSSNSRAATVAQPVSGMSTTSADATSPKSPPRQHKPLVVGRTKPKSTSISSMDSSAVDNTTSAMAKADINQEIEKNVSSNTSAAAPADDAANPPSKKKEKAPKQPKAPKAAPAAAPLSPALLDLRVGHILRAINHPNADSLYVSTIAMGDAEGTEHTQVDEETSKVVRTVCSGLNGLVPLAEMQDRKVIVVANLKPVNMRSIKSAAMVLAASPPAEGGADPHAADRVVELVSPPEGSEAGEKVYFEGWPYGEGKGPEKQLNPKKKQWEGIQPGFFTSNELEVGFDARKSEVEGREKGMLVVEGKGKCTVKSLKGAIVR